jgi:Coenzyme PQQ synthesis protein D (PqqD)
MSDGLRPKRALDARVRMVRGVPHVAVGEETFQLNETGALVWQLCDGSRTVEEISAAIADDYDEDPERICADVGELVVELVAARLLHAEEAP